MVEEQSQVLQVEKDFLSEEFRAACLEIIPFPDLVEPNECSDQWRTLEQLFGGR